MTSNFQKFLILALSTAFTIQASSGAAQTVIMYVPPHTYSKPLPFSAEAYVAKLNQYGRWGNPSGHSFIETVTDSDLDKSFYALRSEILSYSYNTGTHFFHNLLRGTAHGLSYAYKSNSWVTQDTTSLTETQKCDQRFYKYGHQSLINFFEALGASNRIAALDPDARKNLQGIWTQSQKSKGQKIPAFKIFGGYQCQEEKIFLEPELRPLNTAALLAHEMDHFYRSQVTTNAEIPIRTEIFLDEVLAYSLGGVLQLQMRDIGRESYGNKKGDKFAWVIPQRSAHALMQKAKGRGLIEPQSDLTMYNRSSHGFLQRIFQSQNGSICGTMMTILNELGRGAQASSDVRGLAKAISEGNFGRDESKMHLKELTSKVSWEQTPNLLKTLTKEIFSGNPDRNLAMINQELRQLALIPTAQSKESCHRFSSALSSGELNGYVGVDTKVGAEGGKVLDGITFPGAEGGKVNSPIVRACTSFGF